MTREPEALTREFLASASGSHAFARRPLLARRAHILFLRAGDGRNRFQLGDDAGIELGGSIAGGDGQGILDGSFSGAAVADDADAVDSKERRAAAFAVIVAVHEGLQSFLGLPALGLQCAQ